MPSSDFISFTKEDVRFRFLYKDSITKWIKEAIKKEGGNPGYINYIFTSDTFLLNLNKEYLNHHTLTDIITFDYSEEEIESDIFISIDRVKENALRFKCSFYHELCRVMIHGALHLLGYKDKSEKEKAVMRKKEDEYLSLLSRKYKVKLDH